MFRRISVVVIPLLLVACTQVYTLPEAPPLDQRVSVHVDPAQEERESAARYLEARRTLVSLYEAFGAEDWARATELLSVETRLLLSAGGDGNPETSLASGRLILDGASFRFDPTDLFLMENPEEMEDWIAGEEEVESSRRKEVFLRNGEEVRRVVLVNEADEWRVHVRRLPLSRLTLVE